MNEAIKVAILGIVQGLTEFLPVSSSGHLEIGREILGLTYNADDSMMLTVLLHAATALSTIVVFRKEVAEILRGIFQFKWNEESQFAAKIILSMIPAVIIGLKFDDEIKQAFGGKLWLVGAMLCVTAVLLLLAERAKDTDKPVSFLHAALIGIAQAIAILPGISRSGATISTSVLLGIDRMRAARFSFLMVVPLIFGKIAKDLLDWYQASGADAAEVTAEVTSQVAATAATAANVTFADGAIGFAAAFITGVIACNWMLALVRKCQLNWFAAYCFIVGLIAIGYSVTQ